MLPTTYVRHESQLFDTIDDVLELLVGRIGLKYQNHVRPITFEEG
jgi:hypothetical protein